MNLLDFLGTLSGYKQKYERCSTNFAHYYEKAIECTSELTYAEETIRQLELLVPQPVPPTIDYVVERDSAWVQEQLYGMGLQILRLPLDANYRLTNRKNFANIVIWDITDRMEYVRDFFDCPDFAMLFKVMASLIFRITGIAVILDYKSAHAYNLVLFPDSEPMVLEPQGDGMYMWTKRLTDFYSLRGAIALI